MTEDIGVYIKEKQEIHHRQLKQALDQKDITLKFYNHALAQKCEYTEWKSDIFDHFTRLNNELIHQVKNKDYYLLLDRIEKGELYCEANPDDEKAKRGLEGLIKRFEGMEIQ